MPTARRKLEGIEPQVITILPRAHAVPVDIAQKKRERGKSLGLVSLGFLLGCGLCQVARPNPPCTIIVPAFTKPEAVSPPGGLGLPPRPQRRSA